MKLEKNIFLRSLPLVLSFLNLIFFCMTAAASHSREVYQLHRALMAGEESRALRLLDQVDAGALIDFCNIKTDDQTISLPNNSSFFHSIAISKHDFSQEFIARLFAKGASINQQDQNGATPLLLAAARGKYALVRFFITLGADPHIKNKRGQNSLYLAVVPTIKEKVDWNSRAQTANFLIYKRVETKHSGHSALFNLLSYLVENPSLIDDDTYKLIDSLLLSDHILDERDILQVLSNQNILPKKMVRTVKFNVLAMSVPPTIYLGAGFLVGVAMLYLQK